jgi:predicted MFS family arabinose efflux permease
VLKFSGFISFRCQKFLPDRLWRFKKNTSQYFKKTNEEFFKQLNFFPELGFLFLSIFLFAVAVGINFVIFPAILSSHKVSTGNIGIAFTFYSFGGILMSFFLSRVVTCLTIMKTVKISALFYASLTLLIYFYYNFYLWAILIFLLGISYFSYVITRQSWLNIILAKDQRGVALGFFSMIISAGIAFGPLIVNFSGAKNYSSFVISAALTGTSLYCLKFLKHKPQLHLKSKKIKLKDFLKTNPRAFFARFFLDFQTYLLLTFSVVFGVKIGLSYEAAGLLVSAYMASAVFDFAVGFILKKWNPYRLINFGFCGCLCCFLLIIFTRHYIFLVIIYFIFGIFVACIYVSVFKVANDDYHKKKLVAANATFEMIGLIGSLSGSFSGGILFNLFGTAGFPITIVLCCISYLTFLVIYEKTGNRKF